MSWFVVFWRPFSCEDQWPLYKYFALRSLRDVESEEWKMPILNGVHLLFLGRWSSLEPLVLCRAGAWQPMGHVLARVQLGWKRACVSLGCRCFEITWLKTFFWDHVSVSACSLLLSVSLSTSCFSVPFIFASQMISSFRQGCLCTGTALTVPRLTYLLFSAGTHYKVLANNNHAFCSVACLLFGWVSTGSLQPSKEEEEGGQQFMWKINYELPYSCHVVKAVLLSKLYIQPRRKKENTAFPSSNSGSVARTKLGGECHMWDWSLRML